MRVMLRQKRPVDPTQTFLDFLPRRTCTALELVRAGHGVKLKGRQGSNARPSPCTPSPPDGFAQTTAPAPPVSPDGHPSWSHALLRPGAGSVDGARALGSVRPAVTRSPRARLAQSSGFSVVSSSSSAGRVARWSSLVGVRASRRRHERCEPELLPPRRAIPS